MPPGLGELAAPVAEAVEVGDRLAGELDAAREQLAAAKAELEQTRGADLDALVAAARTGGPEPKDATTKAKQAVELLERRVAGLQRASEVQAREVATVTEAGRDGFVAAAEAARDAAQAEFAGIVEQLIAAHERLAAAQGSVRWMRGFPNDKITSWSPLVSGLRIGDADGDVLPWPKLAAALRAQTAPVPALPMWGPDSVSSRATSPTPPRQPPRVMAV